MVKQNQQAVDEWNAAHPGIGHRVRCWPGTRDGDYREAVTTSAAQILGGHTAGVYVQPGGFMALSHVDVMQHATEMEGMNR